MTGGMLMAACFCDRLKAFLSACQDSCDELDLRTHDERYHGGAYDPSMQTCEVRRALENGDVVDLLAAEREEAEAKAQREYADVYATYHDEDGNVTEGWLKAPNGKKSNLTERQWVQARTPSFKAWFGDWESAEQDGVSKIVDENGEPLVVYHGTPSGGHDVFTGEQNGSQSYHAEGATFASSSRKSAETYATRQEGGKPTENDVALAEAWLRDNGARVRERWFDKKTMSWLNSDSSVPPVKAKHREYEVVTGAGSYVTSSSAGSADKSWNAAVKSVAHSLHRPFHSSVYPLYLRMANPKVIDYGGINWRGNGVAIGTTVEEAEQARSEGYDGIIAKNVEDAANFLAAGDLATSFAVFSNSQIKSASENSGVYDIDQGVYDESPMVTHRNLAKFLENN